MLRTVAGLFVAGALAACASVASTVGFPAADADDNDMVSASEFSETFDDLEIFNRFDDDDDGNLSRTEYNQAVDNPYETDVYFKGLDKDSNGSLSRDEFVNGWFAMFDNDKSGGLDRREFRNAMESLEVEL